MLDDKQSSILRPKAVPPMFTPVLTPNTQSTIMNNTARTPQALLEMSSMIRKYDPEATRLYDCIGQVKVFAYNSNELRWENSPNIEGNLCAYERQQIVNNKICPSYAFAIISGEKSLLQPITSDMAQHADKLRLFYEVARNGRREVFCVHFLTEPECLRLNAFLTRCIQVTKTIVEQQQQQQQQQQQLQLQQQQQQQQQARMTAPSAPIVPQLWPQAQSNGQATPTMSVQQTPPNVYRPQIQQTPVLQNPTPPQFGSSRINVNQTPTRLTASSVLAAQQQLPPMHSYPTQIPVDIMNTNLTRSPATAPPTSIAPIELPKPIEQTPFSPSPIPLTNGNNNNTEDPTLSLKRLLNIRGQSGLDTLMLDDSPGYPKQPQQQQAQQNSLDLMPPSAFEPIAATPPSPVVAIGAERIKHRLSTQLAPTMNREHFRNVLLHLVQNDDQFLDIIYQACLTYPPTSQ